MTKELFENFNEQANYNFGIKGNLSKVVVSYMALAKSMGKEDVAIQMISELPPAEKLNNPDMRLDEIKSMYQGPIKSQSIDRVR